MHCHLLIPALFPPASRTPGNDPLHGASAPALETLLARARRSAAPEGGAEAWLVQRFSPTPPGELPCASLALLADGVEPGIHYWLHADPVHLSIERDQLVLTEASAFPLERREADALVDSLNAHFSRDGLFFAAPRPDRWYLRLEQPAAIATRPLFEAAGRGIQALLPTGRESGRWRALLNEIQMLLFGHPVNLAREQRGVAPVNSVWPWGGGFLPENLRRPFDSVRADTPLARGLARSAGLAERPLPGNGTLWMEQCGEGNHLAVLEALRGPAAYGDAQGWRAGLASLERDWFAPLKGAVENGSLVLTLLAPLETETLAFRVTRSGLWHLWRRARPLHRYRPQGK